MNPFSGNPEPLGSTADSHLIDLRHLDRQTLGDLALRREVLALFVTQARHIKERLAPAAPAQRSELAHRLKGSARSVGAFGLAAQAEAVEADPQQDGAWRRLAALVDQVCAHVEALTADAA